MKTISIGLDIPNIHSEEYRSNVSLLDFDLVIWDPSTLFLEYNLDRFEPNYKGYGLLDKNESVHILEDISRRKSEMKELMKLGRVVIIFIPPPDMIYYYTGEKTYSGTGKNARRTDIVNNFELKTIIPISNFSTITAEGSNIELRGDTSYNGYWTKNIQFYQYLAYLSPSIGKPFLFIKGTNSAIGSTIPHENGYFLLIPHFKPANVYKTKKEYNETLNNLLSSLFDFINDLKKISGDYSTPEWTKNYLLPGESEIKDEVNKFEQDLQQLLLKINQHKEKFANIDRYKILICGQGVALENQVGTILKEIGFKVEPGPEGRDDLIIEYEGKVAVVEIKGVSKSAAERHAAQLEKWVSEYQLTNEKKCKGFLIINPYHNVPLDERKESFPTQMIDYSAKRGHCLITSLQLLGLYLKIVEDPSQKEQLIASLFDTDGVYQEFSDYNSFLLSEKI
jgi:hypothetical protein